MENYRWEIAGTEIHRRRWKSKVNLRHPSGVLSEKLRSDRSTIAWTDSRIVRVLITNILKLERNFSRASRDNIAVQIETYKDVNYFPSD